MELLIPGSYYHIYNHANGSDLLFKSPDNYDFFINRYIKHVSGAVNTLAYCLMSNHFHLLIQLKTESDIINKIESKRVLSNYDTAECEAAKEKVISLFVSKQFQIYLAPILRLLTRHMDEWEVFL